MTVQFLVEEIAGRDLLEQFLLPDDVPVVLNVVDQFVLFDRPETGAGEIFACLLLAPHRPQPLTALRQ